MDEAGEKRPGSQGLRRPAGIIRLGHERTMDGFPISRPPLGVALVLLILAVGASALPPLQLIQRIDRSLYDTWSTAGGGTPSEQIVLVYLRDPAWHQASAPFLNHPLGAPRRPRSDPSS